MDGMWGRAENGAVPSGDRIINNNAVCVHVEVEFSKFNIITRLLCRAEDETESFHTFVGEK